MTKELCGHPTANGPCNMKKGHAAPFHRYREYNSIKWTIVINDDVVEEGIGVNAMTYAMSRNLDNGSEILIRARRVQIGRRG